MTPHQEADASTVSVVVPAQRAGALLARQLDALASQQNAPAFTVLVVLDINDPGASLVSSYQDRLSISSVEASMRGAGFARNLGAAGCDGSILLFCDADDAVGPGWVREMAAEVKRTGVCGSAMRVEWNDCPKWARPFYEPLDHSSLQLFYDVAEFVVSASLGIERTLFDAVGGFDDSFTAAGGEEVDLCIRVAKLRSQQPGSDAVSFGEASDDSAIVSYLPRLTFRSIARQRAGYSLGAARVIVKHHIEAVGTVASIDRKRLISFSRSPRWLIVSAWSFVVLRRELRRLRAASFGGTGKGATPVRSTTSDPTAQ
jgi:glycosyltransferase involved in cell wall biosynthesis